MSRAVPSLPAAADLDDLDRDGLAAALTPLFEDPCPLVDPVAAGRPYASWPAVLDHVAGVVGQLQEDQQLRLLAAHPRLGERPEVLRRRSRRSFAEQGGDAAAGDAARTRLAELADAYEDRFGFRCVVFVAGRSATALVPVVEARLEGDRHRELRAGLAAVVAIARDRRGHLGGGP